MEFDIDELLKKMNSDEDEPTFPVGTTTTPETSDATSDVVKGYISSKFNPQDLDEAQRKSQDNRLAVNLADAGSDLGYAIAGVQRPRSDSYDDLKKLAQEPEKRAIEKQRLNLQSDKAVSDAVAARIRAQNTEQARKESNELRRRQIDSNDALRRDIFGVKQQEKEDALTVPEFNRDTSIKQQPAEAVKARDAVGVLDSFQKGMDQYLDLVEKNGSFEYGGKEGGKMESLANGLKLQLKELYELGVLAGPDMGLLETQISDPTSLRSLFTWNDTAKSQMKETKRQVVQTALAKLKAKGYSPRNPEKYTGGPEIKVLPDGRKVKKVPGGWEEVD